MVVLHLIHDRYNSAAGREELLTEHALTWNKWKVEKMPLALAKRYLKVCHSMEGPYLWCMFL